MSDWQNGPKTQTYSSSHEDAQLWLPEFRTVASSCNVDHGGAPCPDDLRPPDTDEEPWRAPVLRASQEQVWVVDWPKVAMLVLVVGTSLGFWGLVLWTISRLLRGG